MIKLVSLIEKGIACFLLGALLSWTAPQAWAKNPLSQREIQRNDFALFNEEELFLDQKHRPLEEDLSDNK